MQIQPPCPRIAFTGHRPDKLGGYSPEADRRLVAFARRLVVALQARYAPKRFISGMALGWDMAVAEACTSEGLSFIAAVPFPQQPSRWPPASKARWDRLCGQAAEVHVLEQTYSAAGLQRRNEWMVDRASLLCALHNGTAGGTANCIAYARRKGVRTFNAWPRWAIELRTGPQGTRSRSG